MDRLPDPRQVRDVVKHPEQTHPQFTDEDISRLRHLWRSDLDPFPDLNEALGSVIWYPHEVVADSPLLLFRHNTRNQWSSYRPITRAIVSNPELRALHDGIQRMGGKRKRTDTELLLLQLRALRNGTDIDHQIDEETLPPPAFYKPRGLRYSVGALALTAATAGSVEYLYAPFSSGNPFAIGTAIAGSIAASLGGLCGGIRNERKRFADRYTQYLKQYHDLDYWRNHAETEQFVLLPNIDIPLTDGLKKRLPSEWRQRRAINIKYDIPTYTNWSGGAEYANINDIIVSDLLSLPDPESHLESTTQDDIQFFLDKERRLEELGGYLREDTALKDFNVSPDVSQTMQHKASERDTWSEIYERIYGILDRTRNNTHLSALSTAWENVEGDILDITKKSKYNGEYATVFMNIGKQLTMLALRKRENFPEDVFCIIDDTESALGVIRKGKEVREAVYEELIKRYSRHMRKILGKRAAAEIVFPKFNELLISPTETAKFPLYMANSFQVTADDDTSTLHNPDSLR